MDAAYDARADALQYIKKELKNNSVKSLKGPFVDNTSATLTISGWYSGAWKHGKIRPEVEAKLKDIIAVAGLLYPRMTFAVHTSDLDGEIEIIAKLSK